VDKRHHRARLPPRPETQACPSPSGPELARSSWPSLQRRHRCEETEPAPSSLIALTTRRSGTSPPPRHRAARRSWSQHHCYPRTERSPPPLSPPELCPVRSLVAAGRGEWGWSGGGGVRLAAWSQGRGVTGILKGVSLFARYLFAY
jgi:hypothetical protein